MKWLTTDEHRVVVERLVHLAQQTKGTPIHTAGFAYTSLMVCLQMHSVSAADSLLSLYARYGGDWFPATTGYVIVRSLFEVDVTAHYISADHERRSRQYIDFEAVVDKKTLEAVERHRTTTKPNWREWLQTMYSVDYGPRKAAIDSAYDAVKSAYLDAKGRRFRTWSGKTINEMAREVDHVESYDILYADLSDFAHVNVRLANRFLRAEALRSGGPTWTLRSTDFDVGYVFRYAAIFLTCFLELFGKEFGTWDQRSVESCWDIPEAEGRVPPNLAPQQQ